MKVFDPVIYPVKLWVATDDDDDEKINEKFLYYPSKNRLRLDVPDVGAITACVTNVRSGDIGVLIKFNKKPSTGLMAHESYHAASRIWERLGEDEWGEEANAYLIQWIVKCITQAYGEN